MTVDINGIEINLANVTTISPIENGGRWQRFWVNMRGSDSIPFAAHYLSDDLSPNELGTLENLQSARQKIINKLNEK